MNALHPRATPRQVLDVSNNRLAQVEGLSTLTGLEDLWLNDNQIADLAPLTGALAAQAASLTTIYLQGNPAAGGAGYEAFMRGLLPKLVQLDDRVLPAGG